MKFILPHKPADMSLATWRALLKRSGGKCEIKECPEQCDTFLEVDHIQARSLGGETSLANTRLVCGIYNRKRGAMQNEQLMLSTWFDELKSFEKLRIIQNDLGPENVARYATIFVGEKRKELLKYISLFGLCCGAGKTILTVSTLLAINQHVLRQTGFGPRTRHVLWLTPERVLCRMLYGELKNEITKFDISYHAPTVQILDQSGDFERGPAHSDFSIACPQALWERQNKVLRTDDQVEAILTLFDTIIVDECDWALEQFLRLRRLARHAMCIVLTATPIDETGRILPHFMLAGSASYPYVSDTDHCLKYLPSWDEGIQRRLIRAISHSAYSDLRAGDERRYQGQHGQKESLPGALGSIRDAVREQIDLDKEMPIEWPDDYFNGQIVIRSSSISEAEDLCRYTEQEINNGSFGPPALLKNAGFNCAIVHSEFGKEGRYQPNDANEKMLFHLDETRVHPFMRSLKNKGRANGKCARLLFVVDTGIRGLNCWTILSIVDIARGTRIRTQVQLLLRASRLPEHLKKYRDHRKFQHFCGIRYIYPESGAGHPAMKDAIHFILNQDTILADARLHHWADLLEEAPIPEPRSEDLGGVDAPLTTIDKIDIDTILGGWKLAGKDLTTIDPGAIEGIIDTLPGPKTERRAKEAHSHISGVINPGSEGVQYRTGAYGLNEPIVPLLPISREEPKRAEDYTLRECLMFVESKSDWSHERKDAVIADLQNPALSVRFMLGEMLRERDQKLFRSVEKIHCLVSSKQLGKVGIVTRLGAQLHGALRGKASMQDVQKYTSSAITDLYGANVKNDGPLDHPSYHYSMQLPTNVRKIRDLAIAKMIQANVLSAVASLYV